MDTYGGAVVLAAVFAVLFALERLAPLRGRTRRWRGRLAANVVMTALTFAAGTLVVRAVAEYVMSAGSARGFGVLHWAALSGPAAAIVGCVLMDATFYAWHRINHEVGVLWRLHQVHHIDPDMDVTTSFRFHVGEVLLSTGYRAAQVAVLGITPVVYLVYELMFQIATMFHHSNWRLPIGAEHMVNTVFVTPRMHGIHHSTIRSEVNSNYSVVFRWWDQLAGSLRLNVPQSQITIGVTGYDQPADNGVWALLTIPFVRPRRVKGEPFRGYESEPSASDRGRMLP